MTAPSQQPLDDELDNPMSLVGLRLWMLCALAIIGFGIANVVFSRLVAN